MTSDDRRIYRVASLTLANAMLFQEIVSQRVAVKTLRKTMESLDIVGEFNRVWKHIEREVDFVPIFKVAREILLALPASPETGRALRRLAKSAIKISRNRAALRHDLMGRIYHRLLADAKFYGAYYTKIPAATLLLKLALEENDWGIEWTDPESIGKLRIADLACGTGTLLKAAMAAIVDRHIEEVIQTGVAAHPSEVHKNLVENSLWGFDVLSSAVHLAAAAIAMHDPRVTVRKMRLYALPLGGGSPPRLGSIDFATSQTLHVQRTLIGASIGPVEATTEKRLSTNLPSLHLCTMNPPFTRSVYGNLLFGGVRESEREELQRRLRDVRDESKLKANITAGLGSIFVAIADRMMVKEGVLALVLPKAVLSGKAWAPTREIFQQYHLRYVICSHEPKNWNFSESTELSEVLLVLAKRRDDKSNATTFINLWRQPKSSIEALAVVRAVQRGTPADLTAPTGTCEIRTNGKKFGEMTQLSLWEHDLISWVLPVSFAQTDLCRVAYHLSQGEIFQPSVGQVGLIEMVKLSDVATLGPDGRDIYDGFSLTNSTTPYAAFWGHDADVVHRIVQVPNQYLSPLTEPLPRRHLRDANLLWSRSGTLMLPKELWLTTNHVAGLVLPRKALSNVWWPTRWLSDDDMHSSRMERRLALWLNSTLGLFTMLMQRQETKGAWVKFPKAWYEQLTILDLGSLKKSQNDALDNLWKQIQNRDLLPFPQMSNDPTRKLLDDVFAQVLGISPNALDQLRSLLSQEPIISMQTL